MYLVVVEDALRHVGVPLGDGPETECAYGHPLVLYKVGTQPGCSGREYHHCDICPDTFPRRRLTEEVWRCKLCGWDVCPEHHEDGDASVAPEALD